MIRDSRIQWLREDHPERLEAVNYKNDIVSGIHAQDTGY